MHLCLSAFLRVDEPSSDSSIGADEFLGFFKNLKFVKVPIYFFMSDFLFLCKFSHFLC